MQILSSAPFDDELSDRPAKFHSTVSRAYANPRTYAQLLDVEVCEEPHGLRLTRIGSSSPLKRLSSVNDFAFYATMEIGDRIVAINGVNSSNIADLKAILDDCVPCEITVFDFRTRLTVSWVIVSRQIGAR